MTFMNRITWCRLVGKGFEFGGLRSSSQLLADDMVLLTPSGNNLQLVLAWFATKCKATGMRISTSMPEDMLLSRKMVEYSLQVEAEVLPLNEVFKYLGTFTSERKMD